ncbi:MAG: hypothetical protein ABFS19_09870 [Thermodesulfobacteriota bacterium]
MTCRWCLVILLFVAQPVQAFYHTSWQETDFELRGFADAALGMSRNPVDNGFYQDRHETFWSGDGRLLVDFHGGEHLFINANILERVSSTPSTALARTTPRLLEVERSSLLSWLQHDTVNSRASASVDVLKLHWGDEDKEMIIGRQPISMATTFYFSPNDFFAPFGAQTFFRVYKPGVDGLRFEKRISSLSQLSIIGVLGYAVDSDSDNGWQQSPDFDRSSLLGRLTIPVGEMEWSLLLGTVKEHSIVGFSFQGEILSWLGVRSEFHYGAAEAGMEKSGLEFCIGLEHRFSNSLHLTFEQYHHGRGYENIESVNRDAELGTLRSGYLGKDYTGAGLSYEFSPLWNGQLVVLQNWTDESRLFSCNLLRSLTDESELSLSLSVTQGDRPEGFTLSSEFGTYPDTAAFEYRFYF